MITQSYIFAHKCIPAVAFHDPHRLMQNIAGPNAPVFLAGLWKDMAEKAPPNTVRPPDGLRSWTTMLSATQVIGVIELPTPWADGEAYFVALVGTLVPPPGVGLTGPRVFTLELGKDILKNIPCTYICEWTTDDVHRNHGQGPPASGQAFVKAVMERVTPRA